MRRVSLCAVLLALAASSPAARASDPPECGATWTGSNACTFTVRGLPIAIRGEAYATSNASVRVWIHPLEYPQLVLAECGDTGGAQASCSARLEPATLIFPNQAPHTVFVCNVGGRSSGSYRCESNRI